MKFVVDLTIDQEEIQTLFSIWRGWLDENLQNEMLYDETNGKIDLRQDPFKYTGWHSYQEVERLQSMLSVENDYGWRAWFLLDTVRWVTPSCEVKTTIISWKEPDDCATLRVEFEGRRGAIWGYNGAERSVFLDDLAKLMLDHKKDATVIEYLTCDHPDRPWWHGPCDGNWRGSHLYEEAIAKALWPTVGWTDPTPLGLSELKDRRYLKEASLLQGVVLIKHTMDLDLAEVPVPVENYQYFSSVEELLDYPFNEKDEVLGVLSRDVYGEEALEIAAIWAWHLHTLHQRQYPHKELVGFPEDKMEVFNKAMDDILLDSIEEDEYEIHGKPTEDEFA